jgi:hypothetical protein
MAIPLLAAVLFLVQIHKKLYSSAGMCCVDALYILMLKKWRIGLVCF